MNELSYDGFTDNGSQPFKGVQGVAAAYVLGISPNATLELFEDTYTTK